MPTPADGTKRAPTREAAANSGSVDPPTGAGAVGFLDTMASPRTDYGTTISPNGANLDVPATCTWANNR
jgi:hypothetical protein